jgi:hypothetical protein
VLREVGIVESDEERLIAAGPAHVVSWTVLAPAVRTAGFSESLNRLVRSRSTLWNLTIARSRSRTRTFIRRRQPQ